MPFMAAIICFTNIWLKSHWGHAAGLFCIMKSLAIRRVLSLDGLISFLTHLLLT